MADLISKQEVCEVLARFAPENYTQLVEMLVMKLPAADAVSRGLFEQIKWERDIAMEQLAEHGIAFGAKAPVVDAVEVVRCKDCKYSMLWRKPTAKAVGECWLRKMYSEDEQFATVDAEDFCSMGKRREENA